MIKKHLLAPGPTPVRESARLAMAAELIHHRGPQFKEIFGEVREHLRWIHQCDGDVVAVTASGTGGFEAALTAFTARGDKIVSIGGGKFAERWSEMGRALGLTVVDVPVQWGQVVDLDLLEETLRANSDAVALTMTASETSTGAFQPVQQVCAAVKQHTNALTLVDGITAVGVQPMPMQQWGIDVMISGSQKAFGVPPGLAFVAVQPSVWSRADRSDHRRYYLDLVKEHVGQQKNSTAFTPAITETLALAVVFREMREEGLEQIWARHAALAAATRAGVRAAGLEVFASHPSNCTTAARVPATVEAPSLVATMRDVYGATIAGGQEHLKPFLVRFGHLGYVDRSDVMISMSALEAALHHMGVDITAGAALTAAQAELLDHGF